MRDTFEMASVLHAYRDFSECVVDAVLWLDHGTTVAVTFDYPWKPDGSIRGDGEERLYVTLTFKHVQEFDVRNALRVMQVADPSCVDWAQNEVALVTIRQDERSRAYAGYSTPFHHAMLRKEGEPYIDIVLPNWRFPKDGLVSDPMYFPNRYPPGREPGGRIGPARALFGGMNDVQIIGAVRRIVRHAARESAFRSFSAGVSLERLDVRCVTEGDGFAIHATYRLRATDAGDTRPVLLDGTRSPFAVDAVRRADGSAGVRQAFPPRRLFLLEPASGRAWEDTVVEAKLRWNRSTAACAVLPDDLPRLRTGAGGGPQPSIRVEASPGLRVGGIAVDPSREWSVENLLQAVLAPADAVRESGDLLLVGRFASGLDAVERERMARLLERIVAFQGRLFGVTFPLRLVVTPESRRRAGGAHLVVQKLETLGLRGGSGPDDVVLGSRLASMWWGVGCRIEGPRARELEAAIRAVAGMLWADFVEGEQRGAMVADLNKLAGRSRSKDWWAGAQGGFRHGLHARWSLALYDALRSAPAAASALRELSRTDRGTFVPESRVLAAFAGAGVRLDGA